MGERDEMAADTLADREAQPCGGCRGSGFGATYWSGSTVGWVSLICKECGGTGVWKGRP